jgi:Ca2+/H+ antiporter, TMEM165/GDT1 family
VEHSSVFLQPPLAQSGTTLLEAVPSSQLQSEQFQSEVSLPASLPVPVSASLPELPPSGASTNSAPDGMQPQGSPQRTNAAFKVFCSTFLTIFLAELGDKTQMTTLLMSAESHAPWTVFAGAGTALVATSLIGVWLGCWLAKRVAPKTLETAAGGLLLLIAGQLFWDIFHL